MTVSFISTRGELPLLFADVAWSSDRPFRRNIEQPLLAKYKRPHNDIYNICDLRQKVIIVNDKCAISVSGDKDTALEFVKSLVMNKETIKTLKDIEEILLEYRRYANLDHNREKSSIIGIIISSETCRFKIELPENKIHTGEDFICGSGSETVNRILENSISLDLTNNDPDAQAQSFIRAFASYLISVDIATSEPQNNYFGGSYSALYYRDGAFRLNSPYVSVFARAHYRENNIEIIPRSSSILDFSMDNDNIVISTFTPRQKKPFSFRKKFIARKWIVPPLLSDLEYSISDGKEKDLLPFGNKGLTVCIDVEFGGKIYPIAKEYSADNAQGFSFDFLSSSNMVVFPEDFLHDLKIITEERAFDDRQS